MTSTALLINDTSEAYHWGCYATATEIRLTLEESGYAVSSIPVADIHNLSPGPLAEPQFSDEGFRRAFLHDNPDIAGQLEKADIVVVNGEGTLHGLRRASFNLLYLIRLADAVFGKPVAVINTSVFPYGNGAHDDGAARLYRTMLGSADHLIVRESASLGVAETCGLEATLSFDCLPRYWARTGPPDTTAAQSGEVILGGGFGLTPEVMLTLLEGAKDILRGYTLVYVTGANGQPANDDTPFIEVLKASRLNIEHRVTASFEDWRSTIANADALISGRFHHTIAAACAGTPAVVFAAGTPKNTGLCEALDLPAPLAATPDAALDFAARVEQALSKQAQTVSKSTRQALTDRAAANFRFLERL